jgi:hypothetical protein
MFYLRKDRFPGEMYNNLKNKKYDPYLIIWKIHNNTYAIDLPDDMAISSTFDVLDYWKNDASSSSNNSRARSV